MLTAKNIRLSVHLPELANDKEEVIAELEYMEELEMPRWAYTLSERLHRTRRVNLLKQMLRDDELQ